MEIERSNENLNRWLCTRLKEFLGIDEVEDISKYVCQLSDKEVREYLVSFLGNESSVLSFVNELIRRRKKRSEEPKIDGVRAYRKRDESMDDLFSSEKEVVKNQKKQNGKYTLQEAADVIRNGGNLSESSQPKTQRGKQFSKRNLMKFLNLKYDIIIPGRMKCECQARRHSLIGNCVNCGRVVCEQEGPGPCFFCNELVAMSEEQVSALVKKDPTLQRALLKRDELIHLDKTCAERTVVIDDQNDYFESERNPWLSQQERERVQEMEKKQREEEEQEKEREKCISIDTSGNLSYVQKGIEEETKRKLEKLGIVEEDVHEIAASAKYTRVQHDFDNVEVSEEQQSDEDENENICLSMHQPWASLLLHGIKRVEGRFWNTDYRGKLWIASTAKSPNTEVVETIEGFYIENGSKGPFPSSYPSGMLLGYVDLVDIVPWKEYKEQENVIVDELDSTFAWICHNPVLLKLPVRVVGRPKLWKLPFGTARIVEENEKKSLGRNLQRKIG